MTAEGNQVKTDKDINAGPVARPKALAMGDFEVPHGLNMLIAELQKPSRLIAEQELFEQTLRYVDEIMRRVQFCG